jgi:hypothetical protein
MIRRRACRALAGAVALLALAPAAPAAALGVVVVGDSLGVGTQPYLEHALPGVPMRFDVEIGRPSSAGPGILARMIEPGDQVVIFDLGTNDPPSNPQAYAADLQAARRIAGNRCMIVATLNRPPVNGVPIEALNQVVRAFAASQPNVLMIPWHEEAHSQAGLLIGDGVHATGAGYAARGDVFAQAVTACLAAPSTSAIPAAPIAPLARAPQSSTIAPPPEARAAASPPAAPPSHSNRRAGENRAVLYGTLAALVGRMVDVVSGNLEA